MPENLVDVEALKELNIPGEKTKKVGAKLKLPEATVKILEVGENPSVKRVKVENSTTAIANKPTTGENK
ncbi:MAG: hypothetical protein AB7D41_03615 [Arcobacter sp.]|jgi:hypothetical protein|uniref:hypothetical protein n=1 Tax=Arcobacter sp. TaxID=1872629 RepID=UPI003D0289CD